MPPNPPRQAQAPATLSRRRRRRGGRRRANGHGGRRGEGRCRRGERPRRRGAAGDTEATDCCRPRSARNGPIVSRPRRGRRAARRSTAHARILGRRIRRHRGVLVAPPSWGAVGEYENIPPETWRGVGPTSAAPSTACSHRPVPARARAARACPAERDEREGLSSDDRALRIRGGCEPHGSPSPGGGARAPTHPQTPERGPRTTSATP